MKICFAETHQIHSSVFFGHNRKVTCILLCICFFFSSSLFSQTTPLTFPPIPYSDPDIISPGRGAEQWDFGSEKINYPTADTNIRPMDVYYRFAWTVLEGDSINSYDWTFFDGIMQQTIDSRQKLSFGIMPVYDGKGTVEYDGARSAYPYYLHKLMQSDKPTTRDWISKGVWIPNWNNFYYIARLRDLHIALNDHILKSSYKGVAFKDAIFSIDIRGYGNYGEWHTAGIVDHVSEYPPGTRPTAHVLKKIIAQHTEVFKNWPLTLMIAAFDAGQFEAIMVPAEVTYYALTTKNVWGPLGWRRDQWGATDDYLDKILKNNEKTFGTSPPFKDWITTRYLTSPITGEPPNYISSGGTCEYWDLERQFIDYGTTSMGNGNFGKKYLSECGQDNVRNAFKRAGYRIILEGGKITSNITAGKPFSITLGWKNTGIAPTYENWNVTFELKNDSNVVVWSGASKFKPKLFAPAATATNITDTYTLPANLPMGIYKLNLVIKDPVGYRLPLPLAIKDRNADGSYTITEINTSPYNCVPPTAKISSITNCKDKSFSLKLDSAKGNSPYMLIINDSSYSNITVGQNITTISQPVQSIWETNPAPNSYEDASIELGLKFKTSVPGVIKGIRFFSPASPAGKYTGHLWTSTGKLLDSVTFTNVTISGWQEALFKTPLSVKADTVYIVSYHTSSGRYAATPKGLTSSVVKNSLTAMASDSLSGNGLYSYGSSPTFPINSFNSTNYWADVIFAPSVLTFNLTQVTDTKGCSNIGNLQTLTATLEPCDTLRTDTIPVVLPTAKIASSAYCNGQSFHLLLDSASGPGPYDLMINETMYSNVAIGDTISSFSSLPQHIWDSIPVAASYEDAPVELGVKFKASSRGYIKGIRFFSSQSPSGQYTGHLWTSSGQLLDSVIFPNVTSAGWQEALFVHPVLISADSIYVASYHTASGRYASTSGGLTNAISKGALTALGDSAAGGNGLYSYGNSPTFPANSYKATNYWVDVVFTNDTAHTYTFKLISVTDSAGNTKNGTLQTLMVTPENCAQTQSRPGSAASANKNNIVIKRKSPLDDLKLTGKKIYLLEQNYPNPFRNETIIQYGLAEPSKVNISLFDMHGRLVKVLLNGSKESGMHTIRFNSGSLSSGIYFYKMQAGSFYAAKKLIIQ